jgi:hypothetical protein
MSVFRTIGLVGAALLFMFVSACGGDMTTTGTQTSSLNHGAGLSCKSTADCETGLSCAQEDPNGQCIKLCTPGNDASCGDPKLACSFEGHCYFVCKVTSDCARASEGYVCKDDKPPRGVKFCDAP